MLSRCAVKGSLGLMPVGKGASPGVPAGQARNAASGLAGGLLDRGHREARARTIAVLARAGAMGNLAPLPDTDQPRNPAKSV